LLLSWWEEISQVSTNAKVHFVESGVVIVIAPDFY